MIPEIGHFSLWLALGVAFALGVIPMWAAARGRADWMALARPLSYVLFALVTFASACLMASFIRSDFSVLYVASNSNTHLPLQYQIAGFWGGHEGSLLLWVQMLVIWMVAVSLFSRHLPREVLSRILAVMGLRSLYFVLIGALARLALRSLAGPFLFLARQFLFEIV